MIVQHDLRRGGAVWMHVQYCVAMCLVSSGLLSDITYILTIH